ncbi:MAG: hypothetical protein Q4B32_09125, partial [Clostridia bacterium]|nr:hypothetical protein [Clostridia bacterium]
MKFTSSLIGFVFFHYSIPCDTYQNQKWQMTWRGKTTTWYGKTAKNVKVQYIGNTKVKKREP